MSLRSKDFSDVDMAREWGVKVQKGFESKGKEVMGDGDKGKGKIKRSQYLVIHAIGG